MANTFTSSSLEQLARAMVAGLWDGGALLNTIYRDPSSDLVAGRGDSVSVREPQPIAAANFTGTATATDIAEGTINVVVGSQPYSQTKLTAKERLLYIEDLAAQVLMPQAWGVIESVEAAIAAKLATTTNAITTVTDWNAAILAARESLTGDKVPQASRYLAVAPDVASAVMSLSMFQTGNIAGASPALADGVLGRVYGFTVVESPFVTAASAVAYHSTAVTGVFRTPIPPEGARSGTATLRGLSAQVIYDYSSTALSDLMTVHTLYGLGTSDTTFAKRAVKMSE